ncbi:hypothetical protein IMCC21906_03112 [Spongiibacter sp. IMCC21906]|uniref:hypothetical protein n=1 Tax=Spongiibacter sp. IMCC21906 TaxID=1620392 RepID=UPI00062E09C1|nr:hypothetical protein [Spongiibacter sp. IMCC21906]AKH70752.1 hypothetical protein IMCC21906_03112 [Spongiibacter sp. IMCC21906]
MTKAKITSAAIGLLVTACATGPTVYEKASLSDADRAQISTLPLPYQSAYTKLLQEGNRNEVLNRMEIGAKAFKAGDFILAKRELTAARNTIERIYADDEDALKARSLWYEEGRKNFKGEPYERSMVYFYLGLIYITEGDYGNAHASFKNGLMQDAFAEEEQNRSDFASMYYLAWWSAQRMGSETLIRDYKYDEAFKALRPDIAAPNLDNKLLVIAETGTAPRKLADGVGHYALVYRRGKNFTEESVNIRYDGNDAKLDLLDSVYFQAATRGGRAVDKIIEGKASFKQKTENIGSTLTDIGMSDTAHFLAYGQSGGMETLGALTLVGVAAMSLSANTKARADTRYWKHLPDSIHVGSFKNTGTDTNIQATFLDKAGNEVTTVKPKINVQTNPDGIKLAFISAR